jgi:fructokinase
MSASYSFYKKYPKKRLQHDLPTPEAGDVILFGSFYSLSSNIRHKLIKFIREAKDAGSFIIYDPNIRKNHLDQIKSVFPLVLENISLASLVRGSDEDFGNLFNSSDTGKVFGQVREMGCDRLIITRGDKGAEMISNEVRFSVSAKKVNVVSTVGAGDTFNAGLIYGLLLETKKLKKFESLKEPDWKKIMKYGTEFASNACSEYDNYISPQFAANYI